MSTEGSIEGGPPESSDGPPLPDATASGIGDLAVLLGELNRVRESEDPDGHSAGEALTLAATAVRIVEAQLGRAGTAGLGAAELATAREVLQGALEMLKVALTRMDGDLERPRGRSLLGRRSRRRTQRT